MTTLNETLHAGGFILREANGDRSREQGTVASGQDLAVGEIVMLSAGELVAHDGLLNTAGDVITPIEGIMYDACDATAAAKEATYIARDCTVNDAELVFPTETTAGGEKAGVTASLAAAGIITR